MPLCQCSIARSPLIRVPDCLNRDDFDYELHSEIDHSVDYGSPYRLEQTHPHEAAIEHPCSELKKILSGGTFYYSLTFDLTNRLQDRYVRLSFDRVRSLTLSLGRRSSQRLMLIT